MDALKDFLMCWFTLKQHQSKWIGFILSPVGVQESTPLDNNPYECISSPANV